MEPAVEPGVVRPRQRVPRTGRQCRVMAALVVVSACSLLGVFWSTAALRPRAPLRASAGLGQRLGQQLAAASSSAVDPLRMLQHAHAGAGAAGGGGAGANSSRELAERQEAAYRVALAARRRRDAAAGRDLEAERCYSLTGQSYRGRQHVTKSGLRCQPWAAQTPNRHGYSADRYPDAGLDGNFCRNPSGDVAPWCYNGEGTDPPYETCAIPLCRERYLEVAVPAEAELAEPDADAGPDDGARLMPCPRSFAVDTAGARAHAQYDGLLARHKMNADTVPLHWLSFYGGTSHAEWDHIVRAHCARMQLRRGESVFEAGSAAGAFVDSLARQYGVRVAGVDLAPSLVAVARRRVFRGAGTPEFCAASAGNLSFVPDASFDHAVSFAVMMYISDASMACHVASELVRIVRPGGKILIGQANDPEMGSLRPPNSPSQGYWDVPRWFWYKFAYERGLEVEVLSGEEVYSKQLFPLLQHYDLHAHLRYNVYLRKPLSPPRPVTKPPRAEPEPGPDAPSQHAQLLARAPDTSLLGGTVGESGLGRGGGGVGVGGAEQAALGAAVAALGAAVGALPGARPAARGGDWWEGQAHSPHSPHSAHSVRSAHARGESDLPAQRLARMRPWEQGGGGRRKRRRSC